MVDLIIAPDNFGRPRNPDISDCRGMIKYPPPPGERATMCGWGGGRSPLGSRGSEPVVAAPPPAVPGRGKKNAHWRRQLIAAEGGKCIPPPPRRQMMAMFLNPCTGIEQDWGGGKRGELAGWGRMEVLELSPLSLLGIKKLIIILSVHCNSHLVLSVKRSVGTRGGQIGSN